MTKPQDTAPTDETAKALNPFVAAEMRRIRALFEPKSGDGEDLVTYATSIVALREALKDTDIVLRHAEFFNNGKLYDLAGRNRAALKCTTP